MLKRRRGKCYIEPKYLLKEMNRTKHVQFLWGEKWGLSFAATPASKYYFYKKYLYYLTFEFNGITYNFFLNLDYSNA